MPAAHRRQHLASFLLVLGLFAGVIVYAFLGLRYHWNWAAVWERREMYYWGWLVTVSIALIALPVSALLGLALALARRARWLPLAYASRTFVELTRGTPLLVQIFFYFYVVLNTENRYLAGTIILSAFSGAYLSEIIRGGIESVGRSQLESARAIGLTNAQTYRFIIFPQAIRQILPGVAGQFVSLIKDSSLLYVIAVNELTQASTNVNAVLASPFESYVPLVLGYLVLTLPLSLWTQALERRWRYET